MTNFPFEVLIIIFKDLQLKDLTRCQLVCRLWNHASRKKLYSNITINTDEKSRLYVRTIKSSPELGNHLEAINAGNIFQKKPGNITWDKYSLLNTIINHCPNLLKLYHDTSSSPFWTKLMYAAIQGRLSRLQDITFSWGDSYDYYVYTVLAFKNTIATLTITDLGNEVPNLRDSEAYPLLRESLCNFPCLKTLEISYKSFQRLSYYDALINDCKHLGELVILTPIHEENEDIITSYGSPINPHHNIHTLECNWINMKEDDELNYFMQKFPNLKSLSVECEGYDLEYFERNTPHILLKFLDFATNVPEFKLGMLLGERECVKVWANVINEKYKNIDVSISLIFPGYYDQSVMKVNFNTRYQLKLKIMHSEIAKILYTKFLSDSGENIQRLHLELCAYNPNGSGGTLHTTENIIQAIRFCPSLQHLELKYYRDLSFYGDTTYQHTEIKSLKLYQFAYPDSIKTFEIMSLILPNLKIIDFHNDKVKYGKSEATTIIMPNTSLDILKWSFSKFDYGNRSNVEIYIRLETNSVERFYVAIEDEISPINRRHYNRKRPQSSKDIYLDITCQDLIKLQIQKFTYIL